MSCKICRVCGSDGPHKSFVATEMMHGTRDQFPYFQCQVCWCLQIEDVPANLHDYYPDDYYSFASFKHNRFKAFAKKQRNKHLLGILSFGGALLAWKEDPAISSLKSLRLSHSHRIADVGCGGGALLDSLAEIGFTNLVGVDPNLAKDRTTVGGVTLHCGDVSRLEGQFDLIMFHHSLEHSLTPKEDLAIAAKRLTSSGYCLVRVPTTSSLAWERYQKHWVQLDAPRHIVIPSREGVQMLAESAGLELLRVIDDSSEFQFLGSELYQLDVPLRDAGGSSLFSRSERRRFKKQARELNKIGKGDQAVFVLQASRSRRSEGP